MLIITLIIFVLCKALPSLNNILPVNGYTRISSIVLLFCAILTFNTLYIESLNSGITIYGGLFHITIISQFIDIFIFTIAAIILIAWPLIKLESQYSTNYSLIILFSLLGSSLLISSYDLISLYLSLELQSLAVYVLATLNRNSELSTSAGLKYFLLGALSSCFILLGIAFIYSFTGLTNFDSIYMLIQGSDSNNILQGFFFGLIFIFVGFLFKIAAAPLHNWAPDVYDDTPTLVTIWLTIMPKISILILLLELYSGIGGINFSMLNFFYWTDINVDALNFSDTIKNLLLITSFLSLIIGSVVGLVQNRIKRLLAYSTISHIGFILLALAINTEQSIDSFLFYIFQYTITNLNLFLIIIAFSYQTNIKGHITNIYKDITTIISDIRYISEFKSQLFINPLIAISFIICLFSMAGVPPLIGFFAKQAVLYSAVQSGYNFISFVAILVSVISASYYLKIIKVLLDEDINKINNSKKIKIQVFKEEGLKNLEYLKGYQIEESLIGKHWNLLSSLHCLLISTLTLTILMFILKPALILNSTKLLSLSLFNF